MSESSKPTPGPWRQNPRHPRIIQEDCRPISEDGVLICSVHGNSKSGFFPVDDEADANARLIAASPELLGEIENTYEWLADIHHNWPGRHSPAGQMRLIRLRNLISKATGRDEQDVQDDFGMRVALANTERKT